MKLLVLAAAIFSAAAWADPGQHRIEVQRALMQRDRQSAEFSRPELRPLHQQQGERHTPVRADERPLQAREREAVKLEEKPAPPPSEVGPSPLPGGLRHGVEPIPAPRIGG